jgi:CheY-like chemotaxis protein
VLPRVFDLFTQAPRTLARSQGGMGIGLTLVQRLVQLHRGTVAARSAGVGQGSEFIVSLPLAEAADAPAAARPGAQADDGAGRMLHVVVVEDNPDTRDILQFALEQRGHRVEPCGDGSSAVERAVAEKPDAMLIDLGIPGRDGYEVARAVRSMLGGTVRLVALTGYGQAEDRERALAAGFDAFLVKPAEIDAVEQALRS